jgi:protein TonB
LHFVCLHKIFTTVPRERKSKHFIHQPVYPGGQKALTEFIYQHLRYPDTALEVGAEGIVWVEYDIDFKGNVVATRVVQGIGHGCDEEACRVVRLLKFEVEKNRGVHVLFHQKAKIQFKKPAPKPAPLPAPAQFQVAYTVTPTPNTSEAEAPASTSTTYSYTIQL